MANVLIADDSWLSRRMIGKLVRDAGHEVRESEHGKDAVAQILESPPDCLVLDLLMPEMDGFEVLQTLRDEKTNVPVVVLSADIQDSSRKKCLDLGANSVINKPPRAEELLAAITDALGATPGDGQ